jgi:hypothetical protein
LSITRIELRINARPALTSTFRRIILPWIDSKHLVVLCLIGTSGVPRGVVWGVLGGGGPPAVNPQPPRYAAGTCLPDSVVSCRSRSNLSRSALFWVITQVRIVIPYRRCGTPCPSHLQGSSSPRRVLLTCLRCVTSQKSADLVYLAAEACNHAK